MSAPLLPSATLVLYGRGALTSSTFNFTRQSDAIANLYSWTSDAIPVWNAEIELAANAALANGDIRGSFVAVNSSRIGGTVLANYALFPPMSLRLPAVPGGFNVTMLSIAGVATNVSHDGVDIQASNRILVMVDGNEFSDPLFLTDVLDHPLFAARPLDVLWCACTL